MRPAHVVIAAAQMRFRAATFFLCAALFISIHVWPAERWSAVISPDNALEFSFVKERALVGRLGLGGGGTELAVGWTYPATGSPWRGTAHHCALRG
jgi:hypothetical protein